MSKENRKSCVDWYSDYIQKTAIEYVNKHRGSLPFIKYSKQKQFIKKSLDTTRDIQ